MGAGEEGRDTIPRPGKQREKKARERAAFERGRGGGEALGKFRSGPSAFGRPGPTAQEEEAASSDWNTDLKQKAPFHWLRACHKQPPELKQGIPFNTEMLDMFAVRFAE